MLVINVIMLHNTELILTNWNTGEFVHSFMLSRQVPCCWAISSTYLKVFILLFLIMWMSMGLCVGVWTWLPVSTGTRRCQISWSWSYHMTLGAGDWLQLLWKGSACFLPAEPFLQLYLSQSSFVYFILKHELTELPGWDLSLWSSCLGFLRWWDKAWAIKHSFHFVHTQFAW